ncbi:MAG: hypothetical protein QW512_03495 [Thermofilaceae archaeon]
MANLMLGVSKVQVSVDKKPILAGNALNPEKSWIDLGLTQGGVTIRISDEVTTIEADQSLAPVAQIPTTKNIEISVPLLYTTAMNLMLAFKGVVQPNAQFPLQIDTQAVIPDKVDLYVESGMFEGARRVFLFKDVRPRVDAELALAKDRASVITVTFAATDTTEIAILETSN